MGKLERRLRRAARARGYSEQRTENYVQGTIARNNRRKRERRKKK